MTAHRSPKRLLLGLVVALGAAACGGSSSGSDPQPTPTPTLGPSPTPAREARLWVLGALPDPDPAAQPRSMLLFSDDLGATWQSLAGSGLADTTTAIDFIDADHGFAVGGTVAQRTDDGGRTWTTVIDGPPEPFGPYLSIAGVQLDASGTAIVLGNIIDDSFLNASFYVSYRVPADGSAFERERVDTPGLAPVSSMCVTASGVGVAVGGFRFSTANLAYSTTLGTRDAGASWENWETISGGGLTWYGTACAGEQDLWRFGSTSGALDPSYGFVIDHSEDGGRSWDGPVDRDAIGDVGIDRGYFIDRSTGWLVGSLGSTPLLLHTTDAGATLVPQTLPEGVGSIGPMAFANERVGFAAASAPFDPETGSSSPLILVTRDGGTTWAVGTLPPGLAYVFDADATPP